MARLQQPASGSDRHKLLRTDSAQAAPRREGARTSVFLAASAEAKGVSGKYFDHCVAVPPATMVEDQQLAQRLWAWTENAVRPWLAA